MNARGAVSQRDGIAVDGFEDDPLALLGLTELQLRRAIDGGGVGGGERRAVGGADFGVQRATGQRRFQAVVGRAQVDGGRARAAGEKADADEPAGEVRSAA